MEQPREMRMVHYPDPLSGEALDSLIARQAEEGFKLTQTYSGVSGMDYYFVKADQTECPLSSDGKHHFIPCDEWSATCLCGETK